MTSSASLNLYTHGRQRRYIREMAVEDMPLNRLRDAGEQALSHAELLACVIQSHDALDLARDLLDAFGGLDGLFRATMTELRQFAGVGPAQASRIKAALEMGRRLMSLAQSEKSRVTSPADAANLVMADMMLLEQEELWVILLDTRNQCLGIEQIYKGSLNTSVVRVGELFRAALKVNAAAIIVAHNHPSGTASPSPEDVNVTRQIVEAGKVLDVTVLDHIVIGHNQFVSLKERGLGGF